MRRGPLAGQYPAAAAMVICALIPYLALSGALQPLTPIIAKQLGMSPQTMSLSSGLANAAYALGTVLAVLFAQHLPQRRMLVGYTALLVIGTVLAAAARDPGMYIVGHVLQGLCTSLLLIAAVPPLVIGYPASKLRISAVVMNIGIFGAVTLGPTIGGLQAQADAWRPLFWIIAAIAALALLLAVLTFEDTPPASPDAQRDLPAIPLAAVGCVAAFFGAAELLTHRFLGAETIAPLLGGLAAIAILIVYQFRTKHPLLAVRAMLTSTMPAAGIVLALCAAGASVSATALTAAALTGHYSPIHLGLLYLPEAGGAVITAILLGVVINKRALHYFPVVGMVFLAAGIAVFRIHVPSSQAATLIGSGLSGIGLGATVVPALFVAGFSVRAPDLQRVFAIIELLRAVAAFMLVPVLAHFAATVGGSPDAGTGIALWIALGIALSGGLGFVALYALGGARAQAPDLERFLAGKDAAGYSPPLLARARHSGVSGLPSIRKAQADLASAYAKAGTTGTPYRPVLFAYDGSDLAKLAIDQAGRMLAPGQDALVVCVWQPADVGFRPTSAPHMDADNASEVRMAAEGTAAYGGSLAEKAGFRTQSVAIQAAVAWSGILKVAEERDASLIVLGSHRRDDPLSHLLGSVAAGVVAHSEAGVLVVHS
jgi:nucleotide-binding universal stress UspA family protein/MFS family permease